MFSLSRQNKYTFLGVRTQTFTKIIIGNKRLINYDKLNKNKSHYFMGPSSITYYFPFSPDKEWFFNGKRKPIRILE